MRALLFLIFIILASCAKNEPVALGKDEPFKKLPFDLRTNFRDTIAKKIVPDKDYKYWAYINFRQNMAAQERTTILSEVGDTLFRKNALLKKETFGFFQGCHPAFCCNYAVIIEDGKEKIIDTEEGFRAFLGPIDNLEEAMLLALSYGYWLDDDGRGNAYRINNGNYEMHLLKFNDYPRWKESVEVIITKEGFVKTKSLGIYCRNSIDCN